MTRGQIVAESWACDERQERASRTENRCRAVLDDLVFAHRWIGLRGHRVAVENVAAGAANTIARKATKHGTPLGGSRRQRKAQRTRIMQACRRYREPLESYPIPF